MKIARIGSLLAGLAVLGLAGYALNRGIFVGSDVRRGAPAQQDGKGSVALYWKHCRYLHITGVKENQVGGDDSREEAEGQLCRMFDD